MLGTHQKLHDSAPKCAKTLDGARKPVLYYPYMAQRDTTKRPSGRARWAKGLSLRQEKAVLTYRDLVKGRISTIKPTKGNALRLAGYSEEMARTPARVFENPKVQRALEKYGLGEKHIYDVVHQSITAKKLGTMTVSGDASPNQIKEALENLGLIVWHMHQKTDEEGNVIGTEVQYAEPDKQTRHLGADMLSKLVGAYAPTKTEGKHTVGVFSLSDLRRKAQEGGLDIVHARKNGQITPSWREAETKSPRAQEQTEPQEVQTENGTHAEKQQRGEEGRRRVLVTDLL